MKLNSNAIFSIISIFSGLILIKFPEKFSLYIITIIVGCLMIFEGLKLLYEPRK